MPQELPLRMSRHPGGRGSTCVLSDLLFSSSAKVCARASISKAVMARRSRRHWVVICTGCPRHTASALAVSLMDAEGHSQPPRPLPDSCGYSFTLMLNWSRPYPLASLCPLDSVPSMSPSKHHQPEASELERDHGHVSFLCSAAPPHPPGCAAT